MSFKSNFDTIRCGDTSLVVSGRTDPDSVDDAAKIYVGLCPVPPSVGPIELKEATSTGTTWSAHLRSMGKSAELNRPKLAVGVAIMKENVEPVAWSEILTVIDEGDPLQQGGQGPGVFD